MHCNDMASGCTSMCLYFKKHISVQVLLEDGVSVIAPVRSASGAASLERDVAGAPTDKLQVHVLRDFCARIYGRCKSLQSTQARAIKNRSEQRRTHIASADVLSVCHRCWKRTWAPRKAHQSWLRQ